ncbi:MAG: SRPBCC family protein [Actinomycetota bacterium]
MPIKAKIQVDASPQRVFDVLADIPTHGSWANQKAGLAVKPVSDGPTAVGSMFHSEQKFAGKHAAADIKVTRLEAPTTLAFEAHQPGKKPVTYTSTFTLTPSGSGTLVERTLDPNPSGLMVTIAAPAIRADMMKALKNLKAKVEGGS